MEGDRLGHTLVLLLSRRDIPDTSRKPGGGRKAPFFAQIKPQLLGSLEPVSPAMFPRAPNLPLTPEMPPPNPMEAAAASP